MEKKFPVGQPLFEGKPAFIKTINLEPYFKSAYPTKIIQCSFTLNDKSTIVIKDMFRIEDFKQIKEQSFTWVACSEQLM